MVRLWLHVPSKRIRQDSGGRKTERGTGWGVWVKLAASVERSGLSVSKCTYSEVYFVGTDMAKYSYGSNI